MKWRTPGTCAECVQRWRWMCIPSPSSSIGTLKVATAALSPAPDGLLSAVEKKAVQFVVKQRNSFYSLLLLLVAWWRVALQLAECDQCLKIKTKIHFDTHLGMSSMLTKYPAYYSSSFCDFLDTRFTLELHQLVLHSSLPYAYAWRY